MRKAILLLVSIIGFGSLASAQDIITLKNGEDIQAIVQEIGEVDVKYKKFDNPNGPNYTMKKSEIFTIRYANGGKDFFGEETTTTSLQNVNGYATLYLYRPSNFAGSAVTFDVDLDGEEVWRCKNGRKKAIKITKEGLLHIHARTEASSEVTINVEFGKEYYVECSIGMGVFVGRPVLSLKSEREGRQMFKSVKNDDTK